MTVLLHQGMNCRHDFWIQISCYGQSYLTWVIVIILSPQGTGYIHLRNGVCIKMVYPWSHSSTVSMNNGSAWRVAQMLGEGKILVHWLVMILKSIHLRKRVTYKVLFFKIDTIIINIKQSLQSHSLLFSYKPPPKLIVYISFGCINNFEICKLFWKP